MELMEPGGVAALTTSIITGIMQIRTGCAPIKKSVSLENVILGGREWQGGADRQVDGTGWFMMFCIFLLQSLRLKFSCEHTMLLNATANV